MTYIKKLVFTWVVLLSTNSFAGGWTSGGGELIRDAHNPWFISNTKEVKYCIQINENDFGQSKSFVRTQIFKAIDFWKMQLRDLKLVSSSSGFKYEIGTQNFYEIECDQNPDISFQFATLDEEQKQRLGDISKTIAVSVRTDYDLKNLKGKGFLFINKNSQFQNLPWTRTEGSRLLLVLIHEMGHVFGIQHTNDVWTMNEDFPEELIEEKNNQWVDQMTAYFNQGDNYKQTSLFRYNPSLLQLGSCQANGIIIGPKPIIIGTKQISIFSQFFGRNENDNCSGYYVTGNTFKFNSGKDVSKLIGEAQLQQQDLSGINGIFQATNIIHFWIPPEQKVFKASEYEISNRNPIATFQPKQFFKGTYITVDGKIKRPIALEVNNSGSITKISGYMNGEIYIDLQSGF